jgi:hypothetical protein
MLCVVCNKKLTGKQRRFCSNGCKGREGNNKHQTYAKQQERALDRKMKTVKAMGGCCSQCGYSKNLSALCFHHIDPSLKSFAMDFRNFSNRKPDVLKREAAKCKLLCANCHSELHHPRMDSSLIDFT